ncbi:LuxR C-terminal-related transcriptional regulator [Nocardia sp. NPDC056000]|uniref:LuxR C-terminal-related transcriptional regulator n=1 Tax=Nocardia sp. NPDC056000 TaxID=3345674 RepID=UPI0035E25290
MTDTFTPIARPELYGAFDAAVRSPAAHVLRICAPAGAGKTLLIADWLDNRFRRSHPGAHIAWLTIADANRAPSTLRDALRQALGPDPHECNSVEEADRRTVLVIDDAHEVTDPKAITVLEDVLNNAPSTRTTIVAARGEPPLRWHTMELRGGVTRLHATDLALNSAHVRQLCEHHGYRPDDAELATLMRLTRGWAALVRIAVRHLAAHHDRPTALAELALVPPAIADLFTQDVLEPLPDHVRRFVTVMSVPDRYTAAQAEYLTGTTAQPILDELVRGGFPMHRAARAGELWCSYHPLLRAHLLAEFRRDGSHSFAELHARTAEWYLTHGLPMSALPHLLHTGEPAPLRRFLRDRALGVVLDGNGPGLFQQIEHSRPELAGDPYLRAMRAVAALEGHNIATATVQLDLLLRRRPGGPATLVPDPWLTPLALATTASIAVATGARLTEFRIPQRLPTTGQSDIDSYAAIELGTIMMARGDITSGDQHFRRALALADSCGNARLTVRAGTRRAIAAGLGGANGRMRRHADAATEVAVAHDLLDSRDARQAAALSAFAEYLCGATASTRDYTGPRPVIGEEPGGGRYAELMWGLIAFDEAEDKYDAAEELRRGLSVLLHRPPSLPAAIGRLVPHVVRVLLEVEAAHSARLIVEQAGAVLGDTVDIVLARALSLVRDHPASARAQVEPLLATDHPRHPVSMITAWVVEASAQAALANPPKARTAIAAAVHRAAPEHLVRPFLDVPGAGALLDTHSRTFGHDSDFAEAVRAHPGIGREHTVANLTATELTVLHQLPSGRTAQQIAEMLGVSITTVKTHLRGIYAKLGANSRAGALDLARRTGLL